MSILRSMNAQQLEEEFRSEFPDLSKEIISACISQHGPDKETCIKILKDIRQDYVFLENTPLPQVDKFDSEEVSSRLQSYDFKFEGSSLQDDENSITKGLNNLTIPTKVENSNQYRNSNENLDVIMENEAVRITNGNFLSASRSNTSNVFDPKPNAYGTPDLGYVSYVPQSSQLSHVRVVNQQIKTSEPTTSYAHNYTRENSYPTTNNRNVPFNTQFSHPTSYADFSAAAKFKPDYSVPLFVMVTSTPHYPAATLTTSHPKFIISPLPTPRNVYPPALSHLSSPYHPPDLTPASFSRPPSSISPNYPASNASLPSTEANSPHPPALSVSPNVPYSYQGSMYAAQNHQRSNNIWENNKLPHQSYKLFPESSATNFMNQNTYLNLQEPVLPPLSNIVFLPQQTMESKENNAERAYKKALINHQKMQLEMLQIEVYKMKQFCYTLRKDVSLLEERLQGKRKSEYTNMEEMQKLREENMNLRVEFNYLNLEYDMLQQKEQRRLELGDEGFYKNIFTGPPFPNGGEKKEIDKSLRYEEDDEESQGAKWNCSKCTYANHPALEHCEMCDSSRLPLGKSPVSPLVPSDKCYCHKHVQLHH